MSDRSRQYAFPSVRLFVAAAAAALLGACAQTANPPAQDLAAVAAAPVADTAGATWTWVWRNGYNGETVGSVREEVVSSAGGAVEIRRTAPNGVSIERQSADGMQLRRARPDGALVDYAPGLPALAFPLQVGKQWRSLVKGSEDGAGRTLSTLVIGEVLRSERIATPAGAFDTYVVRRRVYHGDETTFLTQTEAVEMDWYAPSLGRVVRREIRSLRFDKTFTFRGNYQLTRGAWDIYELQSVEKPRS